MTASDSAGKVITRELAFETRGELDCKDLTAQVRQVLAHADLTDGLLTVFVAGSTGSVVTTEAESGLLQDLLHLAQEIAPRDRDYQHNQRWQDGNGHSHLRATLFGASLSIPFSNGKLHLGTWQQIVFIEFDVRPRRRTVVVQCMGY